MLKSPEGVTAMAMLPLPRPRMISPTVGSKISSKRASGVTATFMSSRIPLRSTAWSLCSAEMPLPVKRTKEMPPTSWLAPNGKWMSVPGPVAASTLISRLSA